MDAARQSLVIVHVAPHADKLRATKIAGADREPAACVDGRFHALDSEFLDPAPVQHRPVFVVDDGPAFRGA